MQARDVMKTTIHTVSPDATIDVAIKIMVEQKISGLPVVDDNGILVGLLTEGDLLQKAETRFYGQPQPRLLDVLVGTDQQAEDYLAQGEQRVSDLMSTHIITVTEEEPLSLVVQLMERGRVRRVPVLRGAGLVGLITRTDLLAALGCRLPKASVDQMVDTDIAASIRLRSPFSSWLNNSCISIQVESGIAVLEGVIYDECARNAIHGAAAEIPGVTTIQDKIIFVEPIIVEPMTESLEVV